MAILRERHEGIPEAYDLDALGASIKVQGVLHNMSYFEVATRTCSPVTQDVCSVTITEPGGFDLSDSDYTLVIVGQEVYDRVDLLAAFFAVLDASRQSQIVQVFDLDEEPLSKLTHVKVCGERTPLSLIRGIARTRLRSADGLSVSPVDPAESFGDSITTGERGLDACGIQYVVVNRQIYLIEDIVTALYGQPKMSPTTK